MSVAMMTPTKRSPAKGAKGDEKGRRPMTPDQRHAWGALKDDKKFVLVVQYLLETKGWSQRLSWTRCAAALREYGLSVDATRLKPWFTGLRYGWEESGKFPDYSVVKSPIWKADFKNRYGLSPLSLAYDELKLDGVASSISSESEPDWSDTPNESTGASMLRSNSNGNSNASSSSTPWRADNSRPVQPSGAASPVPRPRPMTIFEKLLLKTLGTTNEAIWALQRTVDGLSVSDHVRQTLTSPIMTSAVAAAMKKSRRGKGKGKGKGKRAKKPTSRPYRKADDDEEEEDDEDDDDEEDTEDYEGEADIPGDDGVSRLMTPASLAASASRGMSASAAMAAAASAAAASGNGHMDVKHQHPANLDDDVHGMSVSQAIPVSSQPSQTVSSSSAPSPPPAVSSTTGDMSGEIATITDTRAAAAAAATERAEKKSARRSGTKQPPTKRRRLTKGAS